MKLVQIKMGADGKPVLPRGRVNLKQIDMTTEQDILRHATLDDEAYRHQGKSAIDAALAGSCADLGAGCFVK
jgi:hypothetical protein